MRILHIASHTINVGDGLLNFHLRSRVESHVSEKIDWVLHDVHRTDVLSDASLQEFDKIIIGGGGGIDGVSNPKTSGMAANIDFDALGSETLRKTHVVSLGVNLYRGQNLKTKGALSASLASILAAGGSVSLRNDGSLARLAKYGLDDTILNQITEVADPGFFSDRQQEVSRVLNFPKPYVAINLGADNIVRRLAPKLDKRGVNRIFGRYFDNKFAANIGSRVKKLLPEYNIVFMPHTLRDLNIYGRLSKKFFSPKDRAKVFCAPIVPPDRWQTLFSVYDNSEFAIAMRGHALIYCLAQRVPVTVIASHPKIDDMADDYGIAKNDIGSSSPLIIPDDKLFSGNDITNRLAKAIAQFDNQMTEKVFG